MNEKNLSSWWVDDDDDTHTQTCTVKDRVLLACTTVALLICAALVFTLRAGSIALGWRLPVYRSQPPRPGAPKR